MTPAASSTRGGNLPAIERATARDWTAWVALLTSAGVNERPHPEIAAAALAAMPADLPNPEWWAQSVAIAFEQHLGLRVPGQSTTGTFRVSASKTLPLDRDQAIDTWAALIESSSEPPLGGALESVRRSRTEKRSFWRANIAGGGRIEVAATPKDDGRCVLSVEHRELSSADEIEVWRQFWKAKLGAL